jgi:SAM-dependent methyltransferase
VSGSIDGLLAGIRRRISPSRLRCLEPTAPLFAGKEGLEIGGRSDVFAGRSLLPIYTLAATIDNCVFSAHTVWSDSAEKGGAFVYDRQRAPGRQFVHEATDLASIDGGRYDFVLASHSIEHVANPLRALREWLRVMKPEGTLVLVVPHRDGTFDHRRPITTLDHLVDDERRGVGEDDLTHLPEILALHDLALDPPAGDIEAFKARSAGNLANRCLHHHVFDTALVVEMVNHVGLQIVAVEPTRPYHIFVIARKLRPGLVPENLLFRGPGAAYRSESPFATDSARNA